MSTVNFEEVFEQVPSWTSPAEREVLAKLAGNVTPGGQIVEIGALYGGMTIVMALANREAKITSIDNFSWTPPGYDERPACKAEMERNLAAFDVIAEIIEGDSREIWKTWDKSIELLWIDGGHSYEFVKSDLDHFGPYAQTIACHDWDNKFWPTIRKAVEDFIAENQEWQIMFNVETVVVLNRK